MAATLALPHDVLAQFVVALDFPRRDELELIGTGGTITLPGPWLCRPGEVPLEREGTTERPPADPCGLFGLSTETENDDAYRIEVESASRVIAGGQAPRFDRADAVDQATVIEAIRRAAATQTRGGEGKETGRAALASRDLQQLGDGVGKRNGFLLDPAERGGNPRWRWC